MKLKNKLLFSLIATGLITPTILSTPVQATNYFQQQYTTPVEQIQYATVVINSNDAVSLRSMSNISYQIKNLTTNELVHFSANANSYTYDANGGLTSINCDGVLYLTLPLGEYVVSVDNNNGYITSKPSQNVYLTNPNEVYSLDFEFKSNTSELIVNIFRENSAVATGYSIQLTDKNNNNIKFVQIGDKYSYVKNDETGKSRLYLDSSGAISIQDLPIDTYNVFLIDLNDEIMVDLIQTVNLSEKSSINIEIPASNGAVNLSLVDKDLNLLKGATYQIKDANGNILSFFKSNDLNYNFSTNGNVNTISFLENEPILIKDLPAGKYVIVETSNLPGYIALEEVVFQIEPDKTLDYQINKIVSSGALKITTTDSSDESCVEGFKYSIYNKETSELYKFKLNNNGTYSYDEQGDLSDVVTNMNGIITIDNLPDDVILIVGKEAPSGYILDSSAVEKEIIINNTALYDFKVQKSNIAISIVDENKNPMTGVKVTIFDSNKNEILTKETNAKGRILLTDIITGNYSYQIISVPEGFSYDDNIYEFSIDSSGIATNLQEIILLKSQIQVQIGPSNGASLENALFILCDESGNEVKRALTNSQGIATFTSLKFGNYILKQKSAPTGYTCSDKIVNITVNETFKNSEILNFSDPITEEETKTNLTPNEETPPEKQSKTELGTIIIAILISITLVVLIIIVVIIVNVIRSKNSVDDDEDDNEIEEETNDININDKPMKSSQKQNKQPDKSEEIQQSDLPKNRDEMPLPKKPSNSKLSHNDNMINIDLNSLSDEKKEELARLLGIKND